MKAVPSARIPANKVMLRFEKSALSCRSYAGGDASVSCLSLVLFMKRFPCPVRLAALPLALAAAFSPNLFAQTVPLPAPPVAPAPTLAETVVTASRISVPITEVIADVSVVTRETLEKAGPSSLRDVLAQLPGVQFTSNGSYRSTSGIFLRGAATRQTLVLIDGVRVGSATSGGASFENLPLDRIERIEVLRGAASALYGPDAVGGVIQIFTRAPTDKFEAIANFGAGYDGVINRGLSARGSVGLIGYSLGVSREEAAGTSTRNNRLSADFNPDDDAFKSTSFDAKLTAQVHKDHLLTLSLLQSKTDNQFDGRPFPNPGNVSALRWDAKNELALKNVTVNWQAQLMDAWKSTLTVGSSKDESVSRYQRTDTGAFGAFGKFNTERQQITWQNDVSIGKDVLSLALEKRDEAVDSSTVYTVADRSVKSAVVSYALNKKDFNALVVLRKDSNSQFGAFNNWALSGGYKLTDALRVVASVGTSFEAPSFNQLYFPGFGDATLQPQRSKSKEVGVKYNVGSLAMGAVVYQNLIQGFIVPSTNVQTSRAELRGATLTADNQVGELTYSVSYDYADPRTFTTLAASNNLQFVRVARHVLNARVARNFGDVSVFGEWKLSSQRVDNKVVGSGRDDLPGYGTLNAGATYAVNKNLSFLLRINNLFDKQYTLANGFSTPGFNMFASVSYKL